MKRAFAGLLVVAMLVASTAASAGGRSQEAHDRFEEGRALVKAGKPNEAIPKFLESIAAEKTTVALLNLADCYERVGRVASAYLAFREAQALAKGVEQARSDEARKRAEILDPDVPRVTLVVGAGVKKVLIDATPVDPSTFGTPTPLDPGPHEIAGVDASGAMKRSVVRVDRGGRVTVPVDVEPAKTAVAPPPPSKPAPPPPPPAEPASSPLGTIGWVSAGVGVGALVGSGIFGAFTLSTKSDLEKTCPGYPTCPESARNDAQSKDDRAHTYATVSTVLGIAGVVLVAAGVVLVLTAPDAADRAASNPLLVRF